MKATCIPPSGGVANKAMKKIYSWILAIILLLELVWLVTAAVEVNPMISSAPYCIDERDLSRFVGVKAQLYNWLTWAIEPSTEGNRSEWLGSWLASIPIYWGFLGILGFCFLRIGVYAAASCYTISGMDAANVDEWFPLRTWILVVATVIGIYLASYIYVLPDSFFIELLD